MIPKAPCLDCPNRAESCHGSCARYKAYKEELELFKQAQRKNNPSKEYAAEQFYKVARRTFFKTEKRNRKRY